jgi:8-oxo-dGTP pyrophosphatase MutT (NUDIX family)
LCSGFSGTVDKIDINHAIAAGGRLSHLDAPREMVEELGIQRREIRQRHFLGITRELIRGGAPEMFYAIDVDLSADEIVHRIPRDHEGIVKTVFLGPYARSIVAPADAARLPESFWRLVEAIQSSGSGPMSIPLLTNLILWYQRACPAQAGADRVIR